MNGPEPDARWDRVKEIFDHAVELEGPAREALLDERCRDDPELRAEVESLLASHQDETDFLERSAATELGIREEVLPLEETDLTGRRVGPYRLERLIGQGGMGVVYEGQRVDEHFEQRVAIKLVRRGVASDLVLRRFQTERQILARLSHPNVARLLDGGVTETGQPYFVMEYVDGVPIDRYCREHGLSIRERLELFVSVGDAVQFAHNNLVVHRDLKPGNILVTDRGEVKLLDFGIAKLLPAAHETQLDLTATIGRVLTPAYASPEQVTGGMVTTASDVYSLGVILYELLTGRMPLALDTHSLEEVVRLLCSVDPIRPSAAITRESDQPPTQPLFRGTRRQLTGDLDSIVLMALRKEPERRYGSAGQLAEDLRRFLEGLPVMAERDTAGYRLRKFVRRNRGLSAAVALLFLSLVGGLVATTIQGRRAERARAQAEARFGDVRDLANTLLFEIHDQIENLPGSTDAQRLIIERGLAYLDRLAAQSEGDLDLQREVAQAYLRLGGVQGQMAGGNIGDRRGALESYRRARELAEAMVAAGPDDPRALRTLALAHEKLGDVRAVMGEVETGVEHARRALELFRSVADAEPGVDGHRLSVAISHVKLGDLLGHPVFPNLGDTEGAVAQYELSREMLATLPDSGSTLPGKRQYRGLVNERLGYMHRTAARWEAAADAFRRSLEIRLALENPSNSTSLRDVAITRQNLCEVERAAGSLDEALTLCREALTAYRRLADQDPANVQYTADVATGAESLAYVHADLGDPTAALAAFATSVARRHALLEDDPHNASNQLRFGRIAIRLCLQARGTGGTIPPDLAAIGISSADDACAHGAEALASADGEGELSETDRSLLEEAGSG